MTGQIDPRDLVDASDIADRAGVSHPNVVHTWRARYDDFPEPAVRREKLLLWLWADVETWLRETGRME